MIIVHCISSIGVGGAENFVIELCNELALNPENSVHLVSLFEPNSDRLFKISNSVNLHSLDKKKGLDIKLGFRLAALIAKLKPDVVHTHLRVLYYTMPVSLFLRRPKYYHTIHHNPKTERESFMVSKLKKFVFGNGFMEPVFLTNRLRTIGREFYSSNGAIVNNGIKKSENKVADPEISQFFGGLAKKGYTNMFTHVGRICDVKNQELLIDVFNGLNEKGLDACLVFIGYASESDKHLEERLLEKANRSNIFFVRDSIRVKEYLSHSLGFCLTSLNEGQPISIIEALSEGCIPVCTSVGGIPDMYTENEGFLAKVETEDFMQKVIDLIQLDEDEKDKMINNCRKLFSDIYSIESSAKTHLDIYSS